MTVENPAFYLCAGVSGAGCTTAVTNTYTEGLAQIGPTQFATRPLRHTERRGDQYYSVTEAVLEKAAQHIAIEDSIYGNRYGFFNPAIARIRRTIDGGRNVILNAENTHDEWQALLGDYPVVSLFFAPSDPLDALTRICLRAQQGNQPIDETGFAVRAESNKANVRRVTEFDYWIDTTSLSEVMPAIRAVFSVKNNCEHPRAVPTKESPDKVTRLITVYEQNTTQLLI
jgi:guanylate kinase